MDITTYKKVYMIGIGGIGMSAIARYLHSLDISVSGYDKTKTILTEKLVSEHIDIIYDDAVEHAPKDVDLVIYTPAIPQDHPQLQHYSAQGYEVIKRSVALGYISAHVPTIAVAGTHGKTTTSCLIAHLLKTCNVPFSAILGGIPAEEGTNYLNYGNEWMVTEADEYDRSFHQLSPTISILLSMDPDHLDIYGHDAEMKRGFWQYVMRTKAGGSLIYNAELEHHFPADWSQQLAEKGIHPIPYGWEKGLAVGSEMKVEKGRFSFHFSYREQAIEVASAMSGRHNLENACAAMAAVAQVGCDLNLVSVGVSTFQGIARRWEVLYADKEITYVDDYAHHPTELDAAIHTARSYASEKKVLGVFQPHLFSRTDDFKEGFAEALDKLDEIILLPIYPARELPIPGVTSESIKRLMKNENVVLIEKNDLLKELKERQFDILMTLGAGDIDVFRKQIIKWLQDR